MTRRPLLLALVATAACGTLPPPGAAPPPVAVDTLWYVSARAREGGRDTRRLADSLEFGYVLSKRESGVIDLLGGRIDVRLVDSVRVSQAEFVALLGARARATPYGGPAAVLSVHGFATSLHEAWDHTAQAMIRSQGRGPWVVFCWPSNGTGVTWPRLGQLFSRAYREDSASAVASRESFARAAGVVLDAVGGSRLLVVAHSLGAQLVGESLAGDSALRSRLTSSPLQSLAFFAPDVERSRFSDVYIPALGPLARRVVLYAAADDRLLAMSRLVNSTHRAGLISERAALVRNGLETVDVTAGLSAESWALRVFGTHHALRRASAALFDLVHLVGGGYPPECRGALGTAELDGDGEWRLTPGAPPPVSALEGCASLGTVSRQP